MLFSTDKQTLEDLHIFGKHGSGAVYDIFNRTATRGGAALLEELFLYPLSDAIAINNRSGIIRHFAGTGAVFPFQTPLFDAIEPYLDNTDERTKLSADAQPLTKQLGNLIAMDADTALIHKGIHALLELFATMQTFLASIADNTGDAYVTAYNAIKTLLANPAFDPVWSQAGKPGVSAMAAFDALFRFRYRLEVQQLLRHIYQLDVYLAIARVAKERGYCFPVALPKGGLNVQLEGLYHPQVTGAVPNSLHITPEGNVLFLTGANMAGKSTFMKSLSIALYLAHMGFPVPATQMAFSVLDGIYTTINLPDNLGMGASHFYAEVLRVKKMAHELSLSRNLFIVFDELFRGTNVKDAYEATIAITSAFANKKNSLFVISTHILEAGEVLKQQRPNVRFVYLPTRMEGNKPVYTYQLQEGITDDRHGMIIINNEGILDMLKAGIKKTEAV